MKKISLFLCLILVTCLLGCNSAKEPDPSSPENSRQEVSQPISSPDPVESSQPEESSSVEESSSQAQDVSSSWEGAYLDIINDLTEQYGAGAVDTAYTGLVIVKLVDFDQDSQPELFCAYMDSKHYAEQRVYTYTEDGAQLLLTFQTGFSNYCSPLTTLLEKDGLYYIKVKDGAQDMYYGMTDGEFVQTDYIQYGVNTWNGESMENSAFRERLDSYETVYSVDFERIDAGDGPSVLSDTESTIQSLQDAVK